MGNVKRVLFTGGRDYDDEQTVYTAIAIVTRWFDGNSLMFIEGGARGADALVRKIAAGKGIHCATVPALWEYYNNGAGPRRNTAMVLGLQPDLVVAFPGGNGTAHCISVAEKAGIEVWKIGQGV